MLSLEGADEPENVDPNRALSLNLTGTPPTGISPTPSTRSRRRKRKKMWGNGNGKYHKKPKPTSSSQIQLIQDLKVNNNQLSVENLQLRVENQQLRVENQAQAQVIQTLLHQNIQLEDQLHELQSNLELLYASHAKITLLASELKQDNQELKHLLALCNSATLPQRKPLSDVKLSTRQVCRLNNLVADEVKAFADLMCTKLGTTYGERFKFTADGFDLTFGGFVFHHNLVQRADARASGKRHHVKSEAFTFPDDCTLTPDEMLAANEEKDVELLAKKIAAFAQFKDTLSLSHVKLQKMINFVYDMTEQKLPSVDSVRELNAKLNRENIQAFNVRSLSNPEYSGAQLSLKSSLLHNAAYYFRKGQLSGSKLTVLIQADGRNLTAKRQTTLVAYRFPQLTGAPSNSPDHVHPCVIIDADESYAAYDASLADFWRDVQSISDSGLEVPGWGYVEVTFKLCCDMKALLLFSGLGAANSKYACLHCVEPLSCRACCLPEVRAQCPHEHSFDALAISRDISVSHTAFASSTSEPVLTTARELGARIQAMAATSNTLMKMKLSQLKELCQRDGVDLTLPVPVTTKQKIVNRYLSIKMPLPSQSLSPSASESKEQLLGRLATLGMQRAPLVHAISQQHIIPDVLHLLLRVGGKLLKLLINRFVVNNSAAQAELISAFAAIGTRFQFHSNKAGQLEWTSLNGADVYKMLSRLSLVNVAGDSASEITTIWRRFIMLYDTVKSGLSPGDSYDQLQSDLLDWLRLFFGNITGELIDGKFVASSDAGGGYATQDVTPYIHAFICHAVLLMRVNGPLGLYSCQGLEKLNQTHKQLYFASTSRDGGRDGNNRRSASFQLLLHYLRQLGRRDMEKVGKPAKKKFFCSCDNIYTSRGAFTNHLKKMVTLGTPHSECFFPSN